MFYSIRHLTRFRYKTPVSESLMELRMHPRTEGGQRCLTFQLFVEPRTRVYEYRDYLGNSVHHFDVPGHHRELKIVAEALVESEPMAELPNGLEPSAWDDLDAQAAAGDYREMLMPSQFASPSEALFSLIEPLGIRRRDDPLRFLRELNSAIYDWFEYVPKATRVDSPIDHAIEARKGVCQDFAHIMTALARHVRIPCRYVSGYVYPRSEYHDRSPEGATHAWVEALLPGLGWVGFDPTNNLIAAERHIRTAIGRDYADVPPTKGIFKGDSLSQLTVSVRVAPSDAPPPLEEVPAPPEDWQAAIAAADEADRVLQQQQQQQQ
ncbi:MAG: Protein containing transglutaminase-like domain, putative cysteine protease [Bryobacterales bacterium]|nr:Protein containing transglutaminase-like domain, putative cysteine protease [Bryobacterales bacterium]